MPRVRCPRCSTVVEVAEGETPVCPSCGFGRPEGQEASPAPAVPAASPASAAPPAPTAGTDPWGAPTAPAVATTNPDAGPPGKVRSPGLVVVLFIFTFGIYPLIWHWKTGVETDGFRAETRASGMLKGYVWLSIATFVLMAIAAAIVIGALVSAGVFENFEDPNYEPTDEELAEIAFGAVGGVLLFLLAMTTSIVAMVLQLVGLWRVWGTASDEQKRLGLVPLNATMLLLFLLSPLIASVVQLPFAAIPVAGALIGALFSIAGYVLALIAYYKTQVGLNQVWEAHGAR